MGNDFHKLVLTRRSIRKYTDEELPAESVQQILEAALVSPSSKGKMPWFFITVEDKNTLQELSNCKDFGATPIEGCALAVVVSADPEKSDAWIEDSSIAAFSMQLQAEALGLGSCWIQIRNRYREDGISAEEFVKGILSIPSNIRVLSIITFGCKNEERKPYDPQKCKWEKIHIGRWKEDQ